MIVAMKKVALIALVKDSKEAVSALRRLGVMHVEHSQPPKGKDLNQIQEDIVLLGQALEVISKAEFTTGCEGTLARNDVGDWRSSCRHIIDVWKRLDQLQ
jgi:vacuolar-type H+-ATPase subunit I/STV1